MEMNEIGRDQGLSFHLARFQTRGHPQTQDEHEMELVVDTRDESTVLLKPNSQSPGGKLLLGTFPNDQGQQQNDRFKMGQREVELEQQQDQSPNPIVDAHIGTILNRPNCFVQIHDVGFPSAN